jgi:lipoprotein-anchoring transpeptidase ErfK/SrfK
MNLAVRVASVAAALVAFAGSAAASLKVNVDIGSQRMQVYVDGKLAHDWAISSGRRGYETPTGTYRPTRLERDWYSRQYDDAPMPHAIFFSGGYAIHGSYETRRLGRPASHGCIRLAPANAALLFALVEDRGRRSTRITIDD